MNIHRLWNYFSATSNLQHGIMFTSRRRMHVDMGAFNKQNKKTKKTKRRAGDGQKWGAHSISRLTFPTHKLKKSTPQKINILYLKMQRKIIWTNQTSMDFCSKSYFCSAFSSHYPCGKIFVAPRCLCPAVASRHRTVHWPLVTHPWNEHV